MSTSELLKYAKLLVIVLCMGLGVSYAQAAFVGPPGVAPNCPTGQPGCDAPLNIGSVSQTKTGPIWSDTTVASYGGGIFQTRVKIGDLTAANPKAALEIASTNAGILPPRLSDPATITNGLSVSEKTALKGLTVYNTTTNGLERFDGTSWGPAVSVTAAAGVDGPSFYAQMPSFLTLSNPGGAWTYTNLVFSTLINPNGNTDPCAPSAGNCANGPWGYNTANGTFKPSVPGRYLITASVYSQKTNAAGYSCLQLMKNGSLVVEDCSYDPDASYIGHPISVVVDANGTSDTFSLRHARYNTGGYINGTTFSYFSGSRVGNPAIVNQVTNSTTIDVPSGAVMFFDRANIAGNQCDAGWTEYTTADGRYIVSAAQGSNSGSGSEVGSPLSNKENRNNPGPHTHTYTIYDHQHYASVSGALPLHRHYMSPNYGGSQYFTYGGNASAAGSTNLGLTPSGSYAEMYTGYTLEYYSGGNPAVSSAGWTGGMNTGYGTFNSGAASVSSANTNAPYVQLLACKKS